MTTAERIGLVFLTVLLVGAIATLVNIDKIHTWERANNYPYGKLCDVFRNCR